MAVSAPTSRYLDRPSPSGLADVIDLILDKGLVIDVYVRVSLVGIEILTIDARIVVASVDTYLRFAEAVNRLDLRQSDDSEGVPQLMQEATSGAAESKTKGVLDAAKEKFTDAIGSDDDDEDQDQDQDDKQQDDEEREPAKQRRRRRSE